MVSTQKTQKNKIAVAAPQRPLDVRFLGQGIASLPDSLPGAHPLTCQMQDRVRPFRALLQDLDSFGCWQYLELDFAATSLAVHLFHHRQRSGSGADHKPLTLPGYLLFYRERCMPKPVTEPFGRFFLTLTDVASVEHDVILVSGSVNAD